MTRELEQVVDQLKANADADAVRDVSNLALDGQSPVREWARATLLDTMRLHAPPTERTSRLSRGTTENMTQNVIKEHIVASLESKNVELKGNALLNLQLLLEEELYAPETMELYLELAPIVATHPKVCGLIPLFESHLCQHLEMFSFDVKWRLYAQWPSLWRKQLELWLKAAEDAPFKCMHSIIFNEARAESVKMIKYSLYLHLTARQFLARHLSAKSIVKIIELIQELYKLLPPPLQILLNKQSQQAKFYEIWMTLAEKPSTFNEAFKFIYTCENAESRGKALQTIDTLYNLNKDRTMQTFLDAISQAIQSSSSTFEWVQTNRSAVLKHYVIAITLLCGHLLVAPEATLITSEITKCLQYILQLNHPRMDRRTYQVNVIATILSIVNATTSTLWIEMEQWLHRLQYDETTKIPQSWLEHFNDRRS